MSLVKRQTPSTGGAVWGAITGTLSDQTDLQAALNAKVDDGALTSSGLTISTARLAGRTTAGTGAIEEISIGSGLSLSGGVLSCTVTAAPGGSDTQVQFNDGGTLNGVAQFLFEKLLSRLTLTKTGALIGLVVTDTTDGTGLALGTSSTLSALQFDSNFDFAITAHTTVTTAISSGNAYVFVKGSDGSVGIGNVAPATKLDVTGSVSITNTDNAAKELRLYEPSGSGSNYSAFKSPALASNLTYTLPSSHVTNGYMKNDGSGVLSWETISATVSDGDKGDITVTVSGTVWTIDDDVVTNAKMANMAQSTFKGRAFGAGTGDPTDLTATQATAILNIFVGDSGLGGLKGMVPAPGAGDSSKFLRGDATWAAPSVAWGAITGTLSNQTDLQTALNSKVTGATNSTLTLTGTTLGLTLSNANTWTAKQTIQLTTEQLRLAYDASNYAAFTVGLTGGLTINMTGSVPNLTVPDPVYFGSSLDVAGLFYVGSMVAGDDGAGDYLDVSTIGEMILYSGYSPTVSIKNTGVEVPDEAYGAGWNGDMSVPTKNAVYDKLQTMTPVYATTEVDFGSTPVASGTFTITNASVTTSSVIVATLQYAAPTGKDLDEIEMDNLIIKCGNGSGQFDMYIETADGSYLHDKFKINYIVQG